MKIRVQNGVHLLNTNVLRIAVNTRLLLPGKLDGIGWYTYHTLKRMTAAHPEVEFIFFFDRKWSEEFVFGKNVTPVALFPQARHPFLYYLWFEFAVPAALKKYKADLFLSPDGYLSLSTKVPQIPVIHDLNFEHYPGDLPFLTRQYYRYFFPRFARKAARIVTVSEFSKTDICSHYHIDKSKIDVVYNGVNELYQPVDENVKAEVRKRHSKDKPYFIFVGMLHQRKNIANLLRAYEEFRKKSSQEFNLLIVGHRKWWTHEMGQVYSGMKFKDSVIFAGRQPIEELVKLVASAEAMIYPSVFEGFGVPIIEAQRTGVPVITSNTTAMPEVAGDAALLIDPKQSIEIAEAMLSLTNNPEPKSRLINLGHQNAKRFSWERSAEELWKSIAKWRN